MTRPEWLSAGESTPKKNWGIFRLVLLAAFLLALATSALEFLLSYLLSPYRINYGVGQFELYSMLQNLTLFVFNPVISFLVFYRLGETSDVRLDSGYFYLIRNPFIGGLLGYSLVYFANVSLNAVASGFDAVAASLSGTDLINLILGLLRGGADMAFLGFAGVVVGSLRIRARSKV